MTTYGDIYLRDNLTDGGAAPSAGVVDASPDLIPYQGSQLTWAQIKTTTSDQGKSILKKGLNHVYVRARNLQPTGTARGIVRLYYAKSASTLLHPAQWTAISTGDGRTSVPFCNEAGSPELQPNELAIGNQAFVLVDLPTSAETYYLIAIVSTQQNQITPPASFATVASFNTWVADNPAVASRKLSVANNSAIQRVFSYSFGNTASDPGDFYFQVEAPAGHLFPANTTVNIQCTDRGCPLNMTGMLLAPQEVGASQRVGFGARIPGDFTSSVNIVVTSPNNQAFPATAELRFSYRAYSLAASAQDL
jgi:hypothetical protein